MANSADPDLLASSEANGSGSPLFAKGRTYPGSAGPGFTLHVNHFAYNFILPLCVFLEQSRALWSPFSPYTSMVKAESLKLNKILKQLLHMQIVEFTGWWMAGPAHFLITSPSWLPFNGWERQDTWHQFLPTLHLHLGYHSMDERDKIHCTNSCQQANNLLYRLSEKKKLTKMYTKKKK